MGQPTAAIRCHTRDVLKRFGLASQRDLVRVFLAGIDADADRE
ncbi:MAG: hypothetical protein V3V08_23085 [Nannocystaceae bacterium]